MMIIIVDDMSRGIEKLNLEVDDNTPLHHRWSLSEERKLQLREKCASCEQKLLEHNIKGEGNASNDNTCKVLNSGTSWISSLWCQHTCKKCKLVKYCNTAKRNIDTIQS